MNLKDIVISRGGKCGYVITLEVPPADVKFVGPDRFFVVRLYGAHYELTAYASGMTSFRYLPIPPTIRDRLQPLGFSSCVPDILRGIQTPKNASPEVEAAGRLLNPPLGAARREASRAKASGEDHRSLWDRAQRAGNPGRHSVGMMAPPFDHCVTLRWGGELERATIFCMAGMVAARDIQGPTWPLLSLLNGSREYASDFQNGARDCDAILSFV